jgi:hypothetical protein
VFGGLVANELACDFVHFLAGFWSLFLVASPFLAVRGMGFPSWALIVYIVE